MTADFHGQPVMLVAGPARATIDPADGGRLTSWRVGTRELIVQPSERGGLWSGAFPMAPWASLLRGFPCADTVPLPAEVDHPEWHGVARHLHWTVMEATHSSAILATDLAGRWNPGGRLTMQFALTESRLEWRLTMTAASDSPVALGWHPWFVPELDGCRGRVMLPTTVQVQGRTDAGAATRDWVSVSADQVESWDDCLVATWPLRVEYGAAGSVTIRSTSTYMTIFTADAGGMCVEPVTSPAEFADDVLTEGQELTLKVACEFTA